MRSSSAKKGKEKSDIPEDNKSRIVQSKHVRRQHQVLDDLLRTGFFFFWLKKKKNKKEARLRAPIPSECVSATKYAELRSRYATLNAFRRKLHRLKEDASVAQDVARRNICALEEENPEFVSQYEGEYYRALRESGEQAPPALLSMCWRLIFIDPKNVPFIEYLRMDDNQPTTKASSSSSASGI